MRSNFFSSSSILKKFLIFNLVIFLVLGIFTFLYLDAIKPNLVKNRSDQHARIINNTSDHINRLNIEFTEESATEFLIVKELAKRPGIIKERAQLMDIAYKDNNDIEDRTIDSHVKRIRKKFKKVDQNFSAIETRYGSGYRWNVS